MPSGWSSWAPVLAKTGLQIQEVGNLDVNLSSAIFEFKIGVFRGVPDLWMNLNLGVAGDGECHRHEIGHVLHTGFGDCETGLNKVRDSLRLEGSPEAGKLDKMAKKFTGTQEIYRNLVEFDISCHPTISIQASVPPQI